MLAQVYAELRNHLGSEFSTQQVLLAAQNIIDLWFQYQESGNDEPKEKPTYYSDDVFTAFERRTWQILSREAYDDSIEDDRFDREMKLARRINKLLGGF